MKTTESKISQFQPTQAKDAMASRGEKTNEALNLWDFPSNSCRDITRHHTSEVKDILTVEHQVYQVDMFLSISSTVLFFVKDC